MKKTIFTFAFLSIFLFGASIDRQIRDKNRELSSNKTKYNKMDKKLSSVAQKIINAKAERSKLDNKLTLLEKNIKNNQSRFDELNSKKRAIDGELSSLSSSIEQKREKFIALVADKFSMALVLEELEQPTAESIMLQEAYGVYSKNNDREIDSLKEDIERLKSKEKYFVDKQRDIKSSIKGYKQERDEYNLKKAKKTKIIKELARDKAIYKKRFDRIRISRRALQKKLSKLKIIKEDRALERREVSRANTQRQEDRRGGGSIKTASYSGSKTISPMSGSRLIKKFGTYTDPIYKFKIFNKSITLKAPHKGSKVKSVLRGKVVFAENSGGMLGKVVIVSHPNNLHTIYAKLSRLAPGIHVGKRLSKGTIIGKVNKSLMFEVTKNNRHMNPLKLIRL